MYTAPSITHEDRAAGTAASGYWTNPGNANESDGAMATAPASPDRQVLYLSNFGFSGLSKWRLDALVVQEFVVQGPVGENLLIAPTFDGVNRFGEWTLSGEMTGVLEDIGPISLPIAGLDPSFITDSSFGLLIAREPSEGKADVELDYVLLRSSTQRWDTYPMWEQPVDHEDGRAGRVCSASRIWFPGSMLVETELGLRGEPFGGEN